MPQSSAPLNLNSATLQIDFRSGSVEMQLGNERWRGRLPMTAADCSQINTAGGVTLLEKISSESSPGAEG